jgi:PKD repeat protein
MKKIFRLLFVLFFLSFQTVVSANTIIIKGTVKDSSNHYLANKLVKIYSTDSINGGCTIAHTVYTNPNGFYIDTIKCNGDIRKLFVIVENCDGKKITQDPSLTTTGVVESNFIICSNPNIPQPIPGCKAIIAFTLTDSIAQFNSKESHAGSVPGTLPDSIISRSWYFGDSSSILTGNRIDPIHVYKNPGEYIVTLIIKTKSGCESSYQLHIQIKKPEIPTNCKAFFTSTVKDSIAHFNSSGSLASVTTGIAKDSIISRTWYFMDNNPNFTTLTGNRIDPSFTYTKPGTYQVYLVIKTKLGCESKYTESVTIKPHVFPNECKAKANFTIEKIGLKKVLLNSELSTIQKGDSIISRTWKFGDNSYLQGNSIKIEREYPTQGIYTACLLIKTMNGCAADTCKQVVIQDTSNIRPIPVDFIKILAINPNPVITNFRATIYSSKTDIECEIDVYDIYGVLKSSMKKMLTKGNNIIEVQTANLYHGPYFLRVISKSGKDSKIFYKL